ncbi:hypothetical protein PCANC_22841 [Puccinia coronata f. sp. avenae]|uniref:DNA polymerase eta n=1 Tax=Puccinia coronata f. sp. avenae TaxID=200324 RepID=A0A2N5SA18_9BASI|nr:hypothetical protein PCANC_22841 [Puccinia coronata f. sp. avenae]
MSDRATHILTKKIGPNHPLRVIAHCDVDAAYAQFEQVRLKIPPDKPLAVQQWRGLIAVNYPAREFGITRHLPFDEAKKKCPHLICVHVATYAQGDAETEAKYHHNPKPETHKVSLDPYRRESVKILKIFSESCPTIEKASIDEAFLDFSLPVREILCSRYGLPTLQQLQARSPEMSLDDPVPKPTHLDWDTLLKPSQSNIIPLDSDSCDADTWTDIALLIGAELMAQCRQQVFDQLGYTCSAGIATNKMLAKLCSAYKKPNAQTVLRPTALRDFLRPFEVSKLRFLGGKLGQSVAEMVSPSSAVDGSDKTSKSCVLSEVWKIPLEQLQASLGEESGMWVWETVRGVDRSEVETKTNVKSMMSSKNFRPSITTWTQALHWLRILARDLSARLNEAREATPGIWPKVIVMHKRDGSQNSFTKQIAFPFTSQLTDEYIFVHGQKLLQEFSVRQPDQTFQLGTVTSLALAFQTLERIESGQRGIQGFFPPQKKPAPSNRAITQTCQSTGSPHQEDTAQSGSTGAVSRSLENASSSLSAAAAAHLPQRSTREPGSPVSKKPRRATGTLDGFLGPAKRPSPAVVGPPKPPKLEAAPRPPASRTDRQPVLTFVCPRCQEVISLDTRLYAKLSDDGGGGDSEEDGKRKEFERRKTLHLDHHFAQDLSAEENAQQSHQPPTPSTSRPSSSNSLTHQKKSPETSTRAHAEHTKKRLPDSASRGPAPPTKPRNTATTDRQILDFFRPAQSSSHSLPKSKKRKK